MLSISNVGSHQAASYYSKDGYYVRKGDHDNKWQGKLKDKLNFPDNVGKEHFNMLIAQRKERAGYDLCFSAPKSVSIVMCLNEKIRQDMIEIHEKAVAVTLAKIEEREIGTRVTKDGKTEHIKTGNMLCGKFNHYVSRTSDPQLHTHAVILNQTEYEGKIYAIDNVDLYKNKILYGQIYRNTLAAQLLERGYDVAVTDGEKGFFELKDMNQGILEQFSTRRGQILEQLREWGKATPENAAKAAISTRQSKEDKDINLLMKSWKETVDEMGGITLTKADHPIVKKAEEKEQDYQKAIHKLSQRNFAVTEKNLTVKILAAGVGAGMTEVEVNQRIQQDENLIMLAMKQQDDVTWNLPMTEAQKNALALLPHKCSENMTKGQASQMIEELGGRKSYLINSLDAVGKERYVTTRKNLQIEQEIFAEVANTKGSMKGIDENKATSFLKSIEDSDQPLSAEQRNAVLGIATTNDQYFVVQGLAGTGKTYMLNYARQAFEHEGYVVKGACFTGKAANGLQNDANIPSVTLHSHLNTLEKEAGNRKLDEDLQNKHTWNFAGLQKSTAKEVWVVDEASMIDNSTMRNLMEAAKAKGAKVILVGDNKQLLPVGVGNAFGNMVQTNKIDAVVIEDIRRQKDVELLQSVREAVNGDINTSFNLIDKKIQEISKPKKRLKAIVDDYMKLTPEQQRETIVLTAANKDRRSINNHIREELKKNNLISSGTSFQIQDPSGRKVNKEFSVGDKVIFLQNDNKIGVKNGQTAIIADIKDKVITFQSGKKKVEIDVDRYGKIDYGYAMTGYRAQGITVDRALINLDSSQGQMNTRNAFYVDISRARFEVKIYTDDKEKIRNQVKNFAKKLTSDDFNKVDLKEDNINLKNIYQSIKDGANQLLQKTMNKKEKTLEKGMERTGPTEPQRGTM